MQNSETIGLIDLTSLGADTTASISGSPYAITAANANGGTFLASNYNISYINGLLTVNSATLPPPTLTPPATISSTAVENNIVGLIKGVTDSSSTPLALPEIATEFSTAPSIADTLANTVVSDTTNQFALSPIEPIISTLKNVFSSPVIFDSFYDFVFGITEPAVSVITNNPVNTAIFDTNQDATTVNASSASESNPAGLANFDSSYNAAANKSEQNAETIKNNLATAGFELSNGVIGTLNTFTLNSVDDTCKGSISEALKKPECTSPAGTVQPTLSIKNSSGRVKSLQISANRQFLSLLLEDGSVRVWDFQRGVQRQIVTPNKNQGLTDISTVDNEGSLVSVASKANIGAYDLISSSTNSDINEPNIGHFVTSNDGGLLLVSSSSGELSMWDNKQNKELWHLPYPRGVINSLALSNNKHYAAVLLGRKQGAYELSANLQMKHLTGVIDIIEPNSGKIIKSLPNMEAQIVYMQFKDNDTLQLALASGEMLEWHIASDTQKTIANFAETITAVDSKNGIYAYVLKDGMARIGNGQGEVQLSIQNKEDPFHYAMLLDDGKKLLTVLESGDLALWDVASGQKLLRLFSTLQGWTVMDAFGRFDGSEEALGNFSWIADEENIPLDGFSENYYEPGLLTNVLQDKDYLNDNPYIVQGGISLPPKVDLQLSAQQNKNDKVALHLDIYDRGGGIKKIHVYHNGKILNDEQIITAQQKLAETDAKHKEVIFNISASPGKNTVKVAASNTMGIESSNELSFDGKTKAYASSVKLLTVGINQYSDDKLNLDYSVADANIIGETIKNISKITTYKSLRNQNATKAKILAELKELSQGAQQDVLVVYFAGHGMALGKEWYFLPHETKLQATPEEFVSTGITATELSDIFKYSKIQHILLMVDACYSGAGVDIFSKLENGQRYFTRQLSRSLGITVVTATTKDQQAAELTKLGHGLFTYLMAQEIENKNTNEPVTAHSIANKIVKVMPVFSKKMLGVIQEPIAHTHGNDFMLTDVLRKSKTPTKGLKSR